MSKRNDKAGSPLSPSKTTTNHDSNGNSHWRDELSDKMTYLLQQWENISHAQHFYHDALMYMLTSENEPDSDSLIGAMIISRWLHTDALATLGRMRRLQLWIEETV